MGYIKRRILLLGLGVLELGMALLLVRLGTELPQRADVERSFGRVKDVTGHAHVEIERIRDQVSHLRNPELQKLAGELQVQLKVVVKTLHHQKVDFDTLATVRDSLGNVAEGLTGLAKTLEPGHIDQLAEGLGATADFLEKELLPAAATAGKQLEKSTNLLAKDAQTAAKFLKELPVDGASLKEVHDGLAQFGKGLDKMKGTLKIKNLKTLQEGFDGMYTALVTGADQVERLAGFTYPVIVFNGLKPEIEKKPFWPEGNQIAAGLRKAGDGVKAAQQEIGEMVKSLPELQDSIQASQKVIEGSRKSLEMVLKQHGEVAPLLKELPKQAAQIAEDLPKLGQDLAAVLKDTGKFQVVAKILRKAQEEIQMTAKSWPELKKTLLASAGLLKGTQQQLTQALNQKKDYEYALEHTVRLTDDFAALLPLLSKQMLTQLDEQDKSLRDLGTSLAEVGDSMSSYGEAGGKLADTGRWLAWLMAILVALHACYQLTGLRSIGSVKAG